MFTSRRFFFLIGMGGWFLFGPLIAQDIAPGIPGDVIVLNAATQWVNVPKPGVMPEGVMHGTFPSAAFGREIGYCIYLPPGYASAAEAGRRYPVVYNLHGAGGNEVHSLLEAKVLQEGILAGKWPPMILVMPNGGRSTFYKDSADGKWPAETMIIKELIPYIDATYRTIADRRGRCLEGFSMGARGATRLALKYPELFCSLFNQAGNVLHLADLYDPSQPGRYPNSYLGNDKQVYLDNDPYLLIKKNLAQIKDGKLRIQIFCGTADDGHIKSVREFHEALREAGVDHTYLEIEGLAHKHDEMVTLFRGIWFDYHVESLRRAAALK